IVLKRLSDALAAGDTILAVIRGSAVNQDGPSGGLTVPNGPSQQEVIRRALAVGRISPEQIDYVEAHGTGTALGDPIEMGALGAVFAQRTRPLLVGSVKTNVGHLEGAAGIAGVIKVILAMQHEELPQHLHLKRPSPRIPWHEIPIRVVTERTPWARGARPRLAGVSSFGFSGINAHVVLEEPPAVAASDKPRRACHLLTLSAKHPAALEQLSGRFAACTENERLEDVCLTAAVGRSHRERRLAVVADDAADARRLLGHFARGQRESGLFTSDRSVTPVKVAFLFGGDGSQHVGMGRALFHDEPAFRAAFEQCEECFRPFGDRPLREIVYPAAADGLLMNDAPCAQAAIFSLEFALAALWQSWGIRPAALVGHGLGEFAAACVAGVFSLPDAVKLVAARGRLARAMTPRGRMVAVLTSLSEVRDALAGCEETVSVAAINAPRHVVIAGLGAVVDAVVEKLRAAGVATRDLEVPCAFHSPIVDPVLEEFRHVANAIAYHPPQRKLVAARTGRLAGRDVARPEYWCDHVRHPVRFSDSVAQLRELEINAFVELSPQPVLLPLARTCWESDPQAGTARWIGSLCAGRSDERNLLEGLAELYAAGQAVDWQRFALPFAGRKCAAPTYPFQRHRYWIEPVATDKVPVATPIADAVHPLLGRRVHSAAMPEIVQFEAVLGDREPEFLADHQIVGTSVFPATAFMEIALAAGLQARPEPKGVVVLEDLVLKKSMQFSRQQTRVVQAAIKPAASDLLFELHSRAGDMDVAAAPQWTLHATGRLLTRAADEMPGTADLASTQQRCTATTDLGGFYERLREFGLEYGPCFRGLRRLWHGNREVLGQVVIERAEPDYVLYPPALDAALHVTVELINPRVEEGGASGATFVPVGVDRLVLFKQMGREAWSHARLRQESEQEGANQYLTDIDLMEPDGTLVARLEGLRAQRVDFALLLPDGPDARRRATGQSAGTKAPPRDVASQLNGLSPGEQREQVAMFVEEEVVALLKLAGHDRPARDKNLFEMGLDSLMSVDFLYRVNRGLRINLPMQSLLENATIDALTRALMEQLQLGRTVAVAAASTSAGSASEATRQPGVAPTNAWLPNHRVLPGAQVRLFCFPPLGESIEMFSAWEDPLRPDVEVCALQLPGSGSRRDEPPIRQWEPLVETVAEQLLDYLDRPFAFFGQGSGGLLAFDTAHFVRSRFGLAPVHLFLASCPVPSAAPHSPTGDGQAASGPDQTSEP
ncbi:MAG: acyltransferase domain-containing protein, partial [Planctomycetes bacterium]|nr:acyltransferase domain-containing protein [Planctomycetota bacterium]